MAVNSVRHNFFLCNNDEQATAEMEDYQTIKFPYNRKVHREGTYRQLKFKVSKGAKIRNRYNQIPDLTQDTKGKVTNSTVDTTNESQEVSPFPAGDHKVHINRREKDIANTRQNKYIKDPQKKYRLGNPTLAQSTLMGKNSKRISP